MILSPSVSAKSVEELSPPTLSALTALLHVASDGDQDAQWHHNQKVQISTMTPVLLRPSSSILRLAEHLSFPARPQALLCHTHKPLSSPLIRRLFLRLTAEITSRLRRLKMVRDSLPSQVLCLIRRLEVLNSLWLDADLYHSAFHVQPTEARYERIESSCEACILARVGGNAEMLRDLRAVILSRKSEKRIRPRLLAVVEAWIDWLPDRDLIYEESKVLAVAVKHVRKGLKQAARIKSAARKLEPLTARRMNSGRALQARRSHHYGVEDDGFVQLLLAGQEMGSSDALDHSYTSHDNHDFEDDNHDFENEIIDYYSTMLSTANLGLGLDDVHIHDRASPKSRNSMVHAALQGPTSMKRASYSIKKDTMHKTPPAVITTSSTNHGLKASDRVGPIQQGMLGMSAYTQSSYSILYEPPEEGVPAPSPRMAQQNAEDHARAYERLIEVDEVDEDMSETEDVGKMKGRMWDPTPPSTPNSMSSYGLKGEARW